MIIAEFKVQNNGKVLTAIIMRANNGVHTFARTGKGAESYTDPAKAWEAFFAFVGAIAATCSDAMK